VAGRPGLAPGRYFRLLLIGYFEGLDAERAIAWRAADSFALRECLNWIIPLNERHLRHVLAEWMTHYNAERPHSARGPGLPDDSARRPDVTGHRLLPGWRVIGHRRLGGLHHHYTLERAA
jgi:hypothetical protein